MEKKDYGILILFIATWCLFYIAIGQIAVNKTNKNYITNLETKVNIYEEAYDAFVADDNRKQVQ